MSSKLPKTPLPVAAWILLSAFFSCAGWGLSAIHQLNLGGYLVITACGVAAAVLWRRRRQCGTLSAWQPRKLTRRFRRSFAMAFFILAALAILGGVLHAPNNYDGLAYRTPRVLHWLAEGQWHWVHTDFQRLNTRTAAYEWMTAPLIVFTKTDRLQFLINVAPYLLLPGLVFSLFTRVGVRSRVAWHWMWIVPTGYCFLLQAGSIANDLFGAVFALAALDFALRARKSERFGEAALSLLAAALLTGAKASNLPLLLPWAIAFAAAWRAWLPKPVALGALVLPAFGASFLPTAILNQTHGGDWTGAGIEHVAFGKGPAWLHFFNNGVMYSLENLTPPIFPMASAWNQFADHIIPPHLATLLQENFEPSAAHWRLGEMQSEEFAGLGMGVTTLLIFSVIAVAVGRRRQPKRVSGDWVLRAIRVAPWVSLLYVMSKMALSGGSRYLAPYYPLLMLALLTSEGHTLLVRRGWWRIWAHVGFALAAVLVIVSQARPLWPAGWVFEHYGPGLQNSRLGARAMTVYGVYAERSEAFAPALRLLPPDANPLGLVTADDPETSLWHPFGSRRIMHVKAADTAEEIQRRGIQYVLVKAEALHEPFPDWAQRVDARVLETFELRLRAGDGPSLWRLVELSVPPAPPEK